MDTISVARLADATPATRDRYVDLLRVASLGVVVLGHWLMAVVVVGPDRTVQATNALTAVPWLQPMTWLLQVMPVFFLVGGFSHATALASLERSGGGYADFVRARAGRLLRPTAVFVAVWLSVALAVELLGHDRGVLTMATGTVAQPLWFLGVYLGVIALAPPLLRLHRRLGRRAPGVPALLVAAVAAVDLLRFSAHVPHVGYLNVALVWLAIHQMGFFYADGSLQRGGRRLAAALAGTGLAAVLLLTTFGPYPVSMVGLPGERVSNMAPPTLALLAHAGWLVGVVLLLRGPATRVLRRPRLWRAVVSGNVLAMTAYLWHLTAVFAAVVLASAVGVRQPAVGTASWWLLRPLWLALLVAITAALVTAFRRVDRPRATTASAIGRVGKRGTATAAVAMALCAVGILGLSVVGFGGLLAGRTAMLVILPITPLAATAILAAGAALLRTAGRGPALRRAA